MKTLRVLLGWAPPIILAGIFLGGLFWEEKLKINLTDHKLVAIGFLLIFFYLLNRWIDLSERNYLASRNLNKDDDHYLEIHFLDEESRSEKSK
ncbi:hypothetical protein LARV_01434 [Longilinea arvoryzae]|uniref:Uncharacterized protein n=2 Tax=Longilinea arvoryzae TaxID=360412 RepID=A0A0S7B871_9CHLR|nr:hypothetical protein LARV_01434 [Longilinea arvoryzae]